jgi:hypothetical protein
MWIAKLGGTNVEKQGFCRGKSAKKLSKNKIKYVAKIMEQC